MPAEERVQHENVIVVAGSGPPHAPPALPAGRVIAADGGFERARALGLEVDVVVGDLDSITAATAAALDGAGIRVERHPEAKDATDLELALGAAAAFRPARVVVLLPEAGRLDHLVAGILALAAEEHSELEIDAYLGESCVHVIRGERRLEGVAGDLVSLVPVNGPAEGVATEGLEYPLRGETLAPGTTRGVSNVFANGVARVEVQHGVLLAIRPTPGGEATA
jgi:thiamine pyrophosphokinase